jgi:enhancer of polycomb-like protein
MTIVRDPKDLDTGDTFCSRGVTHGHEALDAENEKILTIQTKKKAPKEIPIPVVNTVATYEQDYRADFGDKLGQTYLRRPVRYSRPGERVEYDLDSADEKWLKRYNKPLKEGAGEGEEGDFGEDGQVARLFLDGDKFELMLNKLEFACAEATERALSAGSTSSSSSGLNNQVLASTSFLQRELAFDALRTATGAKHSVLSAVYDYWQQKRAKWGKPLLRRLQAPTSASDKNPFNVFRPRDKPHRPHTRRKRENDMQSFEKMKELRTNMEMFKELLEWVMKRERRKKDQVSCKCDLQSLKIKLHHDPKNLHEQADQDFLTQAKSRTRKFAEGEVKAKDVEQALLAATNAATISNLFPNKPILEAFRSDEKIRKKKRNSYDQRGILAARLQQVAVPPLPPPPEIQEVEMLFTKTFDLSDLPFSKESLSLPEQMQNDIFRVRVGRGGRLIMEKKLDQSHQSEDSSDYFLNSTYKMYPFMQPFESDGNSQNMAQQRDQDLSLVATTATNTKMQVDGQNQQQMPQVGGRTNENGV